MRRINIRKADWYYRTYLALFWVSVLLALLMTAFTLYFAYSEAYALLLLSAALALFGFYGIPFFMRAYKNYGFCLKLLPHISDGRLGAEELSVMLGYTERYIISSFRLCVKKGLVTDVISDENENINNI